MTPLEYQTRRADALAAIAPGMTIKRWSTLNRGDGSLTSEEMNSGWHFCPDWDHMLICKGMPESDACTCNLVNDHVT